MFLCGGGGGCSSRQRSEERQRQRHSETPGTSKQDQRARNKESDAQERETDREPRKAKGGAPGPRGSASALRNLAPGDRGGFSPPHPEKVQLKPLGLSLLSFAFRFPSAWTRLNWPQGDGCATDGVAGPGSPRARDPRSVAEDDLGVGGVPSSVPPPFRFRAEAELYPAAPESGSPGLLRCLGRTP